MEDKLTNYSPFSELYSDAERKLEEINKAEVISKPFNFCDFVLIFAVHHRALKQCGVNEMLFCKFAHDRIPFSADNVNLQASGNRKIGVTVGLHHIYDQSWLSFTSTVESLLSTEQTA